MDTCELDIFFRFRLAASEPEPHSLHFDGWMCTANIAWLDIFGRKFGRRVSKHSLFLLFFLPAATVFEPTPFVLGLQSPIETAAAAAAAILFVSCHYEYATADT